MRGKTPDGGMQRRRRNESWESAACRSFGGKEKWRLAFASQHNTSLTRLVTLQEFDALTAPTGHKTPSSAAFKRTYFHQNTCSVGTSTMQPRVVSI